MRQFLDRGDVPTHEEYKEFVGIMEYADPDILWRMLNQCPKMHWLLQSTVKACLDEKTLEEKSAKDEERLKRIYETLKTRFE
jgi:hypothetical protein